MTPDALRDLHAQEEYFAIWWLLAIPLVIVCVVIASTVDAWQRRKE